MSLNKFAMFARRLIRTTPVLHELVKPPFPVFGINGRYAKALYSAASKQKALEVVEKDLLKLQSLLKTDKELQDYIENPIIQRDQKIEAMKDIALKASLSPYTSNLLQLLAENGRLKNLNAVIDMFKRLMVVHRGEVVCEVTTAKELDATQKQQLEEALKKFLKAGQTIALSLKIDPEIIGGMIVCIDDRVIDMSVATKMKQYLELISVPA